MKSIILWLSMIWLPFLLYFVLKNEAVFKKNIAVGVTFPFEGRQSAEVKERLERFKKELLFCCIGLVLAAFPCMLAKSFNTQLTLWMVWVDLCIILPHIPYVRCNRELKAIKEKNGWNSMQEQSVTVDLAAVPEEKAVSPLLFLPALVLCLLPLAWERSLWPLYLIDALCVPLFYVCCRWLYRRKSEMIDDNSSLSIALTRLRRKGWARLWLICAWCMGAISLVISLSPGAPGLMAVLMLLLLLGMTTAMLAVEFKTRSMQEKLSAGSGQGWYVDEDDKWIWGLFYYNPRDTRVLVNDRVGTNTGVNLAKPAGKAVMLLLALLLAALPFMGLYLGKLDSRPIELGIEGNMLQCCYGSKETEIAMDSIERAELLYQRPEGLSRSWGIASEDVLEGRFSSREYGSMYLCLDPGYPPFLLLETEEGSTYLLGSREEGLCESIYNSISK